MRQQSIPDASSRASQRPSIYCFHRVNGRIRRGHKRARHDGRVSAPLIRNLFIYRDRALAFDLRASTRDNVRSRSLRRARALLRLFRALNYLRTMTRSRTVRPRSVLAFRECASNGFHFFVKKKGERVRLMKFNEAEVCLTKAEQPGFR